MLGCSDLKNLKATRKDFWYIVYHLLQTFYSPSASICRSMCLHIYYTLLPCLVVLQQIPDFADVATKPRMVARIIERIMERMEHNGS